MAELSTWETLPVAGAVRPGGAPRTLTGGWRTGEKPEATHSATIAIAETGQTSAQIPQPLQ